MLKKRNTKLAHREESRLRASDIIVFLICLIGIFVCLSLFYRDLNTSLSRFGETPIATISFKYKAAQRRIENRVVWDRLKQNSPVYEGDLIRTADLSNATVHFLDTPAEITLDENSIIQIYAGRVDFTEGNLTVSSANSNTGIIIASGGKTLSISADSVVNLKTNSSGTVDMQVFEGSALIESEDGTVEATAGNAVRLGDSAELVRQSMTAPLTPHPQIKYLTSENAGVHFSWNAVNYNEGEFTRLEIAQDRNFTRAASVYDVEASEITVPLAQGAWWWRVYPASASQDDAGVVASNASSLKFAVVASYPPALIAPVQDAAFNYRTKLPEVRLTWSETAEAAGYVVEVSQDASFATTKIQTQTGGTSFLCVNLAEGTWYWRVRPVFVGNYAGSVSGSQTAAFSISRKTDLQPPSLSYPADGAFFNVGAERQNSYFAWKRDPEASSYTVTISRNRNLSSPVITRTVRDNFFTYGASETLLSEGSYFWGVTLTDSEGAAALSEVFGFTAHNEEIFQRTMFPPEGYAIAENFLLETRFTWRTNVPAWMRFQVSASRDFSTLLINELTSSESAMGKKLPAGTYYWRIAADSSSARSSNQTVSADMLAGFVTEPTMFKVLEQFGKPQPVSPLEETRVFPVAEVAYRWTQLAGAEHYLLRVYNEKNALLFERDTRNTSVTVNMSGYESGNYYWTVQAMADAAPSQSKRTGQLLLTAFHVEPPKRVRLSSPEKSAEIKFTTPDERGTVRWESDERLDSSRFVLSTNPNPLAGTPLMSITNPPREIQLIPLEIGTYYWTVTAQSNGFDASAEAPSSFTVIPFDPFPPPQGLKPHGVVFDAEAVMNMQNMVFSWNPVAGANAYIFVLEQQRATGAREIVRTRPQRQTSYTAELEILDVGAFTWRVEAVRINAAGRIERHGIAAQGTFTINIQLPQEIKLYDAGTLYGN